MYPQPAVMRTLISKLFKNLCIIYFILFYGTAVKSLLFHSLPKKYQLQYIYIFILYKYTTWYWRAAAKTKETNHRWLLKTHWPTSTRLPSLWMHPTALHPDLHLCDVTLDSTTHAQPLRRLLPYHFYYFSSVSLLPLLYRWKFTPTHLTQSRVGHQFSLSCQNIPFGSIGWWKEKKK